MGIHPQLFLDFTRLHGYLQGHGSLDEVYLPAGNRLGRLVHHVGLRRDGIQRKALTRGRDGRMRDDNEMPI